MTESANYMLTKIIELNRSIDMTELYQGYALIVAGIMLAVVVAMILIRKRVSMHDGMDLIVICVLSIGAVIAGSCLIYWVMCDIDLPYMHDQMDGLIIAYESVYGLLPEGIL